MNHTPTSRRTAGRGKCEELYRLELARGASHIASTVQEPGRARAIADVMDAFVSLYGEADLRVFLEVLAERLTGRGASEAAAAVLSAAPRIPRRRRSRAMT
jgi:hypothetical protein